MNAVSLAALALGIQSANAQTPSAPPNDDFADAISIEGPKAKFATANTGATSEGGEPVHAGPGGSSIWYRLPTFCDSLCDETGSSRYRIDLGGSDFDTLLAVYTGDALNALTLLASNDDARTDRTSVVEFQALEGEAYYVAVDGFSGDTGQIEFSLVPSQSPNGDQFSHPVILPGIASGSITDRLTAASREFDEPNHGRSTTWFEWTAPDSRAYRFALDGSIGPVTLAIYEGEFIKALTEVGRADDTRASRLVPEDFAPSVTFNAVQGRTYKIALGVEDEADANRTVLSWTPVEEATNLFSAVLPSARSVRIGDAATGFVSIVNDGVNVARGCVIEVPADDTLKATLIFQATDPATNALIGNPDAPVDVPAGATQSFVVGLTPYAAFDGLELTPVTRCQNAQSPVGVSGVNSFILSADRETPPDLIAISATVRGDGLVALPGNQGSGVFTIAAINIGAPGSITAAADVGDLPLTATICETDAQGACFSQPAGTASSTFANAETAFYSVFLQGQGENIAFDPANHRVRVSFVHDATGNIVGGTNVAVTGEGENENAPVFTSPSSVTVNEGETLPYTASATDADGNTVTFSILGGPDAPRFTLNAITGALSFASAPDFENPRDADQDNVYELTLRASDGLNSRALDVTITVRNVNDNVPVFTSATAVSVPEDQTAAYDADATDRDGDTLTYSIEGGADADLFSIDQTTGEVTFNTAPDFENPDDTNGDNVYELEVGADDGLTLATLKVTVTVTDVLIYFTSPTAVSVEENQTEAYTASATGLPGIEYALSGGADASLFEIDASTGVLTFKSAPDFENPADADGDNVYDIVVTASEGANAQSQAVAITVTDVFEMVVIDLSTLSASQGFVIQGDAAGDGAGNSVSEAGDINGDGFGDLIVGAPNGDDGGEGAGEAYVIFGGANGFGTTDTSGRQVIDLTDLSPAEGFIIQGDASDDSAGFSVSEAGDINGDSLNDLIIGAVNSDDGGPFAGEAYVIFGTESKFGAVDASGRSVIDLTNLSPGEGFIIQGNVSHGRTGWSTSSAGDIDNDGYDDIIVGAPGERSRSGIAYVIFGKSTPYGSSDGSGRQVVDLAELSAGDGFLIQGPGYQDYDGVGRSVANAGDINGDGFDDIIVGTSEYYGGETYVVFGGGNGFGTTDDTGRQVIETRNLSEADGFRIQGLPRGFHGGDVSGADDINGDGFDDLIVGAGNGDAGGENAGEAYVIFGTSSGFGTVDDHGRRTIDAQTLSPSVGFVIQGMATYDLVGTSVSSGNINGDGFDDLVIGAPGAANTYVIFGKSDGFGAMVGDRQVIDLASLSATEAFIIQGDKTFDPVGGRVSSVGDMNSDGFDDIILGAPSGDDGGDRAGQAYVIFGSPTGSTGGGSALGASGSTVHDPLRDR